MKKLLFAALAASLFAAPVLAHGDKACKNCVMGAKNTPAKTAAAKLPVGIQAVTLSAPKMHCAGCAQNVKQVLMKVEGVKTVSADPQTKFVAVTYVVAKQTPAKLASALTKAGFPAAEVKAKKEVKTSAGQSCPGGKACCMADGKKL